MNKLRVFRIQPVPYIAFLRGTERLKRSARMREALRRACLVPPNLFPVRARGTKPDLLQFSVFMDDCDAVALARASAKAGVSLSVFVEAAFAASVEPACASS